MNVINVMFVINVCTHEENVSVSNSECFSSFVVRWNGKAPPTRAAKAKLWACGCLGLLCGLFTGAIRPPSFPLPRTFELSQAWWTIHFGHYPGIQIGSDVLNERSTALHSRVKATNALFILSGRRWRRWRLVLCFLGSWETPCLAALVSLHIPATAHRMGLRKMNALRLCAQVSTSVQIQ